MDPTTTCCPKRHCPARGQTGQGNIGIHAQKEHRCICHACHKTFSARTGPVFSRLRTAAATVVIIVTWLAPGCPLQALVAAFGVDERTMADWWARSGRQGHAVHASLVEQPRDLGQVQADARRVKQQGGTVWMALAMMGTTRWWLGGEGRERRDLPLIRRLMERGRRCAACRPLLVCTDGVVSSRRAMRETFREPVHTGQGGGPRRRPWCRVVMAQGVKRSERRRVGATVRRLLDGTPARDGPGMPRAAGAPVPGAGTPYPDVAQGDVRGGHGLELVHAACECVPGTADDASHGGGDHRPWLDAARAAVVSCSAASLVTAEAAWASFIGTSAPDCTLVFVTTVSCGATALALCSNNTVISLTW
jgi:transposase-like protein